eukprot:COSAG04_NODE_19984_length_403_cov_1.016447_1_plen_35_part_10
MYASCVSSRNSIYEYDCTNRAQQWAVLASPWALPF